MSLHLSGMAACVGWLALTFISHTDAPPLVPVLIVQAWAWAILFWTLRQVSQDSQRISMRALVGWAVAFRVCGLIAVPMMEDDYFRYLWDGWRLLASGNPYDIPPATFFSARDVPERMQDILDQVNYPHVPTIYGPVCQYLFGIAALIAPGQLWIWKSLVFVFDVALLGLTSFLGGWRPRSSHSNIRNAARAILLIGWAPLMVFESSFNAHPDIVGVALLALALVCSQTGKWSGAGVSLALAAGAKVFALPLVPFVLRRSRRGWLVFIVILAFLYLPFWFQGSAADLGGLLVFGRDWEFNSSLYALVKWPLGPDMARIVCAGVFLVVCVGIWFYREFLSPRQTELSISKTGMIILGAFFLLSTTVNPWYLLWFAPFLVGANSPSPTVIAAWALICLSYVTGLNTGNPDLSNFEHPAWLRPVEYGAIALVVVVSLFRGTLR